MTPSAPQVPARGSGGRIAMGWVFTMWEIEVTETGVEEDRVTFYALTDTLTCAPNVPAAYDALRGAAGFELHRIDAVRAVTQVRRWGEGGGLVIRDRFADQRTCVVTIEDLDLS